MLFDKLEQIVGRASISKTKVGLKEANIADNQRGEDVESHDRSFPYRKWNIETKRGVILFNKSFEAKKPRIRTDKDTNKFNSNLK